MALTLIPANPWLSGTTAPNPQVGFINQFYLNLITGEVYQKKTGSLWAVVGHMNPDQLSSVTLIPKGTNPGETGSLEFKELAANGNNYAGFKAPDSLLADIVWTLPEKDGNSGQALVTDGAGHLTWASGSSLSPVTSVNTKTGDVVLTTTDIAEGTNLYFTDTKAQTAVVVDNFSGAEINKSPSVASTKTYVDTAVENEANTRASADATLQTNINNEANARSTADSNLHDEILGEIAARTAADALLIPLTQKGTALGVASLDASGKVPSSQINFTSAPVQSVNTKTGDVVLKTVDIEEDTNLYFTDSRAQTAAVVDSTSGSETNKAPSVHAAKDYTDTAVSNEQIARQNADDNLQTNINNETTARTDADTALGLRIDQEITDRTNADTALQSNIDTETAARIAADALLIPLTQKGQPEGVATLDATGQVPTSQINYTAAPVQSVNTKTGNVVLKTVDVEEDTNLYFTDARAQTAVVVDLMTGGQTDKSPSVSSAKEYIDNLISTEQTDRQNADNTLQSNIEAEANTRAQADTLLQDNINAEALARENADALLIPLTQKGQPDGVATLDNTGKIPATQIPPTAITSVTVVATIAERDALTPGEGDFCVVTDVNETYVYNGSAWIQLEVGSAVTAVNGKTGAVSLSTQDISEVTNLYFTDARAKTAAVINSMAGSEIDQAPSVQSVKTYVAGEILTESTAREQADTLLQNNINSEATARENADTLMQTNIDAEATARAAADALLIPLTQKGAPNGVATLDGDGKLPSGLFPAASDEIGTPTDGSYSGGLLEFTPTTRIADATDGINLILAKLAPAKPPNLSSKTISLTSSYSAKEAGTNTLRSNVTDTVRPQISTVTQFYDGDNGTLSVEIDSSVSGSVALTTSSEAGTYGALVVTADADYYAGVSGKEGFWRALSAYLLPASNLTLGHHTYQMKHSTTGNTNLLDLYVDNPATATISGESIDFSSATSSYVSGVPTLSAGTSIKFDFSIASAVGKFFNSSKVADVSGSNVSTANIAPDVAGYAENATISVNDATVTVNSSSYSESPSVSIRGYNSKSVAGTSKSVSLGSRIDTASNESARKVSGSGQYPSSGYGGSFDSSVSLKTTYSEELQMLNGSYQFPPSANYSSNVPVAGPDYSSGMGSGDRWVTFAPQSLTNASAFTLTFNGAQNFSGTETSGIKVYAKVEGQTGWIDCNKSYPGVGSPSNNGDPAMVNGSSSATVKRVTFGSTVRTGTLYIRIALPSGSNKKFTSISISSVV